MKFYFVLICLLIIYTESLINGFLFNIYDLETADFFKWVFRFFLFLFASLISLMYIHKINYKKFIFIILIYGLASLYAEARLAWPLLFFFAILMILFGFFVGYIFQDLFFKFISVFFVLNLFISLIQLLGITDIFYFYQAFSDDPISWVTVFGADSANADFQLRPTGLFSNTIAVSLFQVTIFSMLWYSTGNRLLFFLFGIWLGLLGSTTSLLFGVSLVAFSMFRPLVVFAILGWLGTMFIYQHIAPSTFELNYSVFELLRSLEVRIDPNLNNSMFQSLSLYQLDFPLMPTSAASLLFLFLSSKLFGFYNILRFFLAFFLLSIPLFLHPVILDIKFAFLFGFFISRLDKFLYLMNMRFIRFNFNWYSPK